MRLARHRVIDGRAGKALPSSLTGLPELEDGDIGRFSPQVSLGIGAKWQQKTDGSAVGFGVLVV